MYNGFEVDVLALGNADCIVATSWYGTQCTRIMIDGGCSGSAGEVRSFLRGRGISHLDHIVSTHPHDDHIGGLETLVLDTSLSIGKAWMHIPWRHVDWNRLQTCLSTTTAKQEAKRIRESLGMSSGLFHALQARHIPIEEPFAGKAIGFLRVCGPSPEYYEELLEWFCDNGKLADIERSYQLQAFADMLLENSSHASIIPGTSEVLEDNPETSPENNSSTILATTFQQSAGTLKFVFTGDAGAQALVHAANTYDLSNCFWLQIPHHGSRRNITESLISHFRPTIAYVSADGTVKHPRRAVVNAFKSIGTAVFSTHHPTALHRWSYVGSVPNRADYSRSCPLWEAPHRN